MYLYCTGLASGSGCNQISTCWNPAMATSVSCTNSGTSTGTNTFACYVSKTTKGKHSFYLHYLIFFFKKTTNTGVGTCFTSSSFTTSVGTYCFSSFCNTVAYKVGTSGGASTRVLAKYSKFSSLVLALAGVYFF